MGHHPRLTRYRRSIIEFTSNPGRSFLKILFLVVIFSIATPVLADYLGPNRTVTETTSACKIVLYECQFVPAKGDWRYKRADDWSCSNEGKPWQAYSDRPSSQGCFAATAGDQYWEREETVQQTTTTYPPATISGSLQNCTANNGWCTSSPQLSLVGSEPVSGYQIIAIEGKLNGQSFACSGKNCSVPLNEGNNNFTYWALSSWGDSSTMGSLTTKVDSRPPSINGSFTGTMGANNWYISPVDFNGSASDSTSGLASFTCTLDGSPLGTCNSINVNTDGPHTIVLTARDNAGHTATVSQNASVDTKNPILTAGISGTAGSNSWYTSASLNATASDPSPGSGMAALEYNIDSGSWAGLPGSGTLALPEGKHSIDVRALDNAGRMVSTTKLFWLDSGSPSLTVDPTGTLGSNGWYVSGLSIAGSAIDSTSGIDLFEFSLNNSSWTTYSTPISLLDGTHNLSFWAQDYAGHVTQVDRSYKVDTRTPQIGGSLSGIPGANGWYVSDVTLSASAADPVPGSGLDSFAYTLNGGSESAYVSAVSLSDGQHTVELIARDNAGLIDSAVQIVKVDTIAPSLTIQTALPSWIHGSVTIRGIADDSGSGLSKVEITTDGGQTWNLAAGNTSWSYAWNSQNSSNGIHDVQVRASDKAGLIAKRSIQVGVDNRGPRVGMPESWFQWDTISLDIRDEESGVAEARVEIRDPEGRWPARIIRLEPDQFPIAFKWDRRFADDTVAPLGSYNVKVVAWDGQGNMTTETATINILLGILPPGPTATPQPVPRTETVASPTAISAASPTIAPTQTAVVSVFGIVEPTLLAIENGPTPFPARTAPVQTSFVEWLESFTAPVADAFQQLIEVATPEPLPALPAAGAQASALWGAAAAGVIGAATAYALEEARKRKEEEERQAAAVRAEVDAINAALEEQRQAKWEAQKVQNWLEGQAMLNAQIAEAKKQGATAAQISAIKQIGTTQGLSAALGSAVTLTNSMYVANAHKNQRVEEKEAELEEAMKSFGAKPLEWEAAHSRYIAQQAMESWRKSEQEVYAPPPGPTWWDHTKSFVSENILQPFNTYLFQPYLKPAIERDLETISNVSAWVDEHVMQPQIEQAKLLTSFGSSWFSGKVHKPIIQPVQEKLSEAISAGLSWTNEHIVQPHLKPLADKAVTALKDGLAWTNEHLYRPYVQPILDAANEKIYKPYIKPVVEAASRTVSDWAYQIDKYVYQPIFEPVVSDIHKHIIQPIVKPLVNDAIAWSKETWGKYGEWVHTALDIVGFIPGFGEVADLVNGVIYLAEGRYLEAQLSALAMIPMVGDLFKGGKVALKLGKEVLEEGVERIAKESIEVVVEQAAKEVVEEATEKVVKEAGEELIEQGSEALARGAVLQPLVTDIAQKFYDEWIHKALDLVGVMPGYGELTSAANSLLYLGKGRYLDATLSAMSMVPVAGELAQAGVSIFKIAKDIAAEKAAKQLAEKAAKEAAEAAAEKLAKEAGEDLSTQVLKESVAESAEKAATEIAEDATKLAAKETVELTAEKTVKEVGEELTGKVAAESVEEGSKKAAMEVGESIATKTTPEVPLTVARRPSNELSETVLEKSIEDNQDPAVQERTQLVQTLNEKYGERMVEQFLPFCEKHGINPSDVLTNPPVDGQSLIGWALGIDNPANPVNQPLVELNLTQAQLDQIRTSSIRNADSKVVVLGYGQGAEKPYYQLGEEIEASYLSLSNESWAPFENARANFWNDINSRYINDAIKERKIFIFNIDESVITNPRNVERFSLPELRLIEAESNEYVKVPVGDYMAYVPLEMIDNLEQHLHPSLTNSGE